MAYNHLQIRKTTSYATKDPAVTLAASTIQLDLKKEKKNSLVFK